MEEQKIQSFSLYMDMAPLVKAMDSNTAARWIWAVFQYIDGIDTDNISDDAFINAFWEQTKIKLQMSIDKAIRRSESAQNAINTRWGKHKDTYKENTEEYDRIRTNTDVSTIQNINSNSTVLHKDSTDTVTDLQKDENGSAAPAYAAAAVSPFTFADVQECAEENGIELSRKQLENFYAWMQKYGWTINGRKVTKLENALSGYAKKHGTRKPAAGPAPELNINHGETAAAKTKRLESECLKIAQQYIPEDLWEFFPNGRYTLANAFVPMDSVTREQLEYMREKWHSWPSKKPMGDKLPRIKEMIREMNIKNDGGNIEKA